MQLTFTSCQAVSWDVFYVRGSRDDADPFAPFSRVLQYAKGRQRGGYDWAYNDYPFASGDMTLFRWDEVGARILTVLGEPGVVASPDAEFAEERMVDPAFAWQEGLRLGRMTALRQIDGDLYAVGEGGQNYRRAGGAWPPLDRAFFRPEIDPDWDKEFFPSDLRQSGKSKITYLLEHPDIMTRHTERLVEVYRDDLIYGINGPSAEEIYICGKDGLLAVRTDEAGFRRLPQLTDNRLLDIAVLDAERIVVCGEEGELFVGNHRHSFRPAATNGQGQIFRRMAVFGGRLYLAGGSADGLPGGLFVLDGRRVKQVETGLDPEIGGLTWLSATDEMLLAVGHKEIVRFDGKRWDRVDYPGNQP
ncbi:hypothetical protein [Afifella aestuarii]|uniref:hypothetical protein n=1 Tax=Afifella aestuarii TaxID=1909496 RepID=UPI000FE3A49C|nr:hypothetical protein [Afifella aestuarii]